MSKTNWEAEERKLQSVYDDIQNGRINSAASTTTRWLKKHPSSQPALIMKMYMLQRTGAEEKDVLRVYEEVKKTGVLTSKGFWWTGLTLRNIPRLDLALQLHQDMLVKHPESLDLANQVFLHAAAAWDIDTLVSSSRKLFNVTREIKWAREAAWTEFVQKVPNFKPTVENPFPALASPLKGSLKIAQTLLSTTGKAAPTSEILWLRLQILLASEDYRGALNIAREEGWEGSLARLWWRMEGVKVALIRMQAGEEEWEVERDWTSRLLTNDTEAQWNYTFYRHLLSTTTKLSIPESLKDTDNLLLTLHARIGDRERAPLLARLELQDRLRAKGSKSDIILSDEAWLALVDEYWRRWGSKGSISTELAGIVGDDRERREVILDLLRKKVEIQHTDLRSFREQSYAETILVREQKKGWTPTTEDAKRLWTLYLQGLDYGKNLPKTDVQPADQIGLIAVNLVITIWHTNRSDWHLIYLAIGCLEFLVEKSPANMHARFLLIRLYRLIGAPSLITPHLTKLNLSEIQLDNVLHIVVERGSAESVLGDNVETWSDHAKKANSMYARSRSDLPEYVKQAVAEESYSKITGIRSVAESLDNSLSASVLTIEQARLSLLQSGNIPDHLLVPLRKATTKDTFEDLRNWELLQEIHGDRAMIRDITALGGGAVSGHWSKTFAGTLLALGSWIRGEAIDLPHISVEGLLEPEAALINAVHLLLKAAQRTTSAAATPAENGAATPADSNNDGDDSNNKLFDGNLSLALAQHGSRWEVLQAVTTFAELLRISELVATRLTELSKPVKGKKKSSQITALLSDLNTTLKSTKGKLDEVRKKLDDLIKEDEVIKLESKDFIYEGYADDVAKKIRESRKNALERAKALLSGKAAVVNK